MIKIKLAYLTSRAITRVVEFSSFFKISLQHLYIGFYRKNNADPRHNADPFLVIVKLVLIWLIM